METSIKPETADSNGIVKPEPSDVSSMSHLPSRDAVQPGSSEEPGHDEPNETNCLERLCNNKTLGTLETAVSVATRLLDQLQDALGCYTDEEVDRWMKAIVDLRKRTAPARTVVGVVGNTGAGKSSVINALLDEERLLPTNCLRACTASPTEISFNYSDDPQELYRAEIEFISAEEWIRELQVLFSDLLDGNGQVSRDATKSDSDAGIAYEKVKAVYPKKTREMLAQANPKDLASEPAVRVILGTTKVLKKETAKEVYQGMQHYVDSKEKSTGPISKRDRADIPMEYWPLIKVVRIFTKANALSTGAVIVDLPGVQDSNAARAAVAANYMKSCTGLWIVAPITRAVDDKTAKSLLGDSFKRQLKYDGTYSAVSFICSKTDDISITEAADSLGLEAEISESWDAAEKMRRTESSLQSRISNLKEAKRTLGQQLDECEANTDLWEDLESQISSGKTVYAPSNSKKRRRDERPLGSRKNLKSDVDDDWIVSDSGPSDKENSQSEQRREPLIEENIEEHISLLRAQRKNIRGERRSLDSQIAMLSQEMKKTKAEREKILADVKAICIQGRNSYSRGAIKQDFAMGIKELDQENAIEEDDATFDPDQDTRDYDKVAHSLPVFCVSSRAYQKLSGKLEKDDIQSHGFPSTEDTEIPKLQEHAKKLTEAGRTNHCRHFLNDLSRLVNSMKLWSADDGTGSILTDDEKSEEENHLKKLLGHLEEELESSLKLSITSMRACLQEHIFDNINESMPLAIEAAPDTAYSWGAPRGMGGLFWSTYKATVRRQGVYSGASGPRDFNQELFDPVSRSLATGWERAFQRRLPAVLKDFAKKVTEKLQQFHETAKARAERRGTNITGLITLSSQIQAHTRTVQALPDTSHTEITVLQREASRNFTPAICDAMMDAYTICTNEHGPGSYARMKEAMAEHVEAARYSMFNEATEVVKENLEAMCRFVMEEIGQSIQFVYNTIHMEYMRTLVGREVDRSKEVTREELDMRSLVHKILIRGDKLFAPILCESNPEASDGTITDNGDSYNSDGTVAEDYKDIDELMQADIREQGSIGEAEDDPFASDDEFSIVLDLTKKEG
ncbi:hypothetical protein E0Z10_g2034 [Xylaria hypoxylon]|uniref:G domain-containing protein n=1 Tax=Xylaria hypoxylon TaxID=37992 RepID=A0A4Z0ZB70_9PEZI|nr:hypothetical protein E0Z10_g2034 [Xylaria hypoxylon]